MDTARTRSSELNATELKQRPTSRATPARRPALPVIPRLLAILLALATVMLWLSYAPQAWAQSTANFEPALRDSVQEDKWEYILPIWGQKVLDKGFELPLPAGINLQYLYNYQEMHIGNLQLGVNDGGLTNVSDFIDIGQSSVVTNSVQVRPDLYILPFLNVYGLVGTGQNVVDVTVGKPTEFQTRLDRKAFIYGFGGNISGAISRYFVVLDGNLSWADVDGIDKPTQAYTISGRIGRSFLLPKDMRIAGWIGFMKMGLDSETSGSIRLGDALPGLEDFFADYQESEWYNDLGPLQQRKVDDLFTQIAERDPQDSTIQYAIDKELASQWSIVLGGQYQFTPHWMLRWEYSHSDRRGALLLNLNYRFGF